MSPSPSEPIAFPSGPRVAGGARRVIGPIPPRDKSGKLMLAAIPGKRVKTNALGEAVRDERGQPIEEPVDLREAREYAAYEAGHERQISEGATKGLHLYQVDLKGEPLVLVYARNEDDAIKVFRREMGIQRFGPDDPRATQVTPS